MLHSSQRHQSAGQALFRRRLGHGAADANNVLGQRSLSFGSSGAGTASLKAQRVDRMKTASRRFG
jgi:hypothetical protein